MSQLFHQEEIPDSAQRAEQPAPKTLSDIEEVDESQAGDSLTPNSALLELTAGTVALTLQPFALEFRNAKDRKLVLKQHEITALICQLSEAKLQQEALVSAAAKGTDHSDGLKWSQPIGSSKNYKVVLELGVYKKYSYLVIQPYFLQDKMRQTSEETVPSPAGNDNKIRLYFDQLQRKKKEEALGENGWVRTLSNFRIRAHEVDALMDFVIINMV